MPGGGFCRFYSVGFQSSPIDNQKWFHYNLGYEEEAEYWK